MPMELDDADQWVCLRQAREYRAIAEASLVLSAMGVEHQIDRGERQWSLWVPANQAQHADRQLDLYRRENAPANWPGPTVIHIDRGWAGVAGFLLLIWALPSLEAAMLFGWDWRQAGAMDAALVRDGQWWRTITALTLHGDIGHLVGNSLFGVVFGLMLARHMGSGFGWLLVLLAAACGNTLNAYLQPDGFVSIGASTATFAALGLVASFVWYRGYYRKMLGEGGWRRSAVPLVAAFALLVFTGIGGPNVDIMAHFTGFLFGVIFGVLAAWFDPRRLGYSGQYISGALALLLVVQAWRMAGAN